MEKLPYGKHSTKMIRYKGANSSDFAEIALLEKKIFVEEGPWELEELERDFNSQYSMWLVAKEGFRIVGYAACFTKDREMYLTANAVSQEFRKMGIGRTLLERILQSSLVMADFVVLHTRLENEPLIKLVSQYGFKIDKTIKDYYGQGKDAYLMIASQEVILESLTKLTLR